MKERPILMSAPMVRAILAGEKSQTRRALRDQPCELLDFNRGHLSIRVRRAVYQAFSPKVPPIPCPYGRPGDRLWVRETWAVPHRYDHLGPSNIPVLGVNVHYAASEDRGGLRWRPSIHMCRWASRITLEVSGVRVERLQDISEADAKAEGIVSHRIGTGDARTGCRDAFGLACDDNSWAFDARQAYQALWESINGPGSWDANPWVWVIEFRRIAP